MIPNDRFDIELRRWLRAEAPATSPTGLHEAVMERARRSRQRPRWLVVLRGDAVWGSTRPLDRPKLRVAYLVAILALLLAIVFAAIVGAALRSEPIKLERNGPIAYSVRVDTQRTQPYIVHMVQADGTDRSVAFGSCPTFSKDGTTLIYLSGTHSTTELNVARADASGSRVLLVIGESDYAISPDGTQIAWFKSSPVTTPDGLTTIGLTTELWVTPTSGGPGVRIVAASGAPDEWYRLPEWSPDGSQIAFVSTVRVSSTDYSNDYRRAVYVVNRDGTGLRQLSARPGTTDYGLTWSPDGRAIAYLGLPDGATVPSLDAPGGLAAAFEQPLDIFVVDVGGTGDRDLTNTPVAEGEARWSPDGAHMAFSRLDEDGTRHVATMKMNGSAAAGPPIEGPDSRFAWSPDGTTLLLVDTVPREPSPDPSLDPQPVQAILRTVDADLRGPIRVLRQADNDVTCTPTWQGLQP